jgi:hypothetical protein
MELNDALRRVRALVTLAEDPNTPEHEAALARQRADALMLKFAIDEATAESTKPSGMRGKPIKLEVELAGNTENLAGYVAWLAEKIGRHTRCKVRPYSRFDRERKCYVAIVYGYESDIRYFETLYTTLRLHMLGAVRPSFQSALSLELNCYLLHEAGFNWLEIAEMRGWRKFANLPYDLRAKVRDKFPPVDGMKVPYYNASLGEVWPATRVGGEIKRAYLKEITRRGEKPTKISAGGAATYRKSAMEGYVTRINQRLYRVERARDMNEAGALVLRSDALEDFFREDYAAAYTRCPRCEKLSSNPYKCEYCGQFLRERPEPCPRCEAAKSGHCRDHPAGRAASYGTHDERAYQRGTRHADTADIGGSKVSSNKKEID